MDAPRTRAHVRARREIIRTFAFRAAFVALPCDVRVQLYKLKVRDDPRLPPGWEERHSRADGSVYLRHVASRVSQWVFPSHLLPRGWRVEASDSASPGTRYFWHAVTKTRQWSFPRADAQWMLPASMPRR